MAREEKKDGIKRVAADGTVLFVGDLRKSKRCSALEVDSIGEGERSQRGERRTGEKVGCCPVFEIRIGNGGDKDVRKEGATHFRGIE